MEFIYLIYSRFQHISRKRKLQWMRFCFVAIISIIFIFLFNENKFKIKRMNLETSQIGLKIFIEMIRYIAAIATITVPITIIRQVLHEKYTNAQILLLTLKPNKIILSRYVTFTIILFLYYMATIPIFLLCMPFGGIDGLQIVSCYLLLFGYIALIASICFAIAAESKSQIEALFLSYFCGIFILIALSLIQVNPLLWIFYILSANNISFIYVIVIFLVNMIISLLFLWSAAKRFLFMISLSTYPSKTEVNVSRKSQNKLLGNNKKIIVWKDQRYSVNKAITRCSNYITCCLIYFSIVFIYSHSQIFLFIMLFCIVILTWINSLFLFYESPKNLELLMLTTLSARDFAKQKFLSIYYNVRWLLLAFLVTLGISYPIYTEKVNPNTTLKQYLFIFSVTMSLLLTVFFNGFVILQQKSLNKALKFIILFAVIIMFLNSYVTFVIGYYNQRTIFCCAYAIGAMCLCHFFFALTVRTLNK